MFHERKRIKTNNQSVKDMPKTRSGKIMRRVLAAISNEKDVGDVTTLANPEIVDEIRTMEKR
jgi:acetyl-CoA synthetase